MPCSVIPISWPFLLHLDNHFQYQPSLAWRCDDVDGSGGDDDVIIDDDDIDDDSGDDDDGDGDNSFTA